MPYYDVPIQGGAGDEFNEAYAAELKSAGLTLVPSADGDFALRWVKADTPEEAERQAEEFVGVRRPYEIVRGGARPGPAPPWLVERHLGDEQFGSRRMVDASRADDAIKAAGFTEPGEYSVRLGDGKSERVMYRLAADGTVSAA